jgi:hypothetical protein
MEEHGGLDSNDEAISNMISESVSEHAESIDLTK